MKNKATSINYRKLLLLTVKERYFNLVVGMIVSLIVSSFIYQLLLKNTTINIAFSLSKINPTEIVNKSTPIKKELKNYTVMPGDDLWHIAEKFYGSGHNAFDISEANNINPDLPIEAGQNLIIPEVTRKTPTVGEISATSTDQVTYKQDKYIVKIGDSLSSIALRVYGDLNSWPTLMRANNLTNPDQIEIGMTLIIPR